jgi:hypothetical protein
LNEGNLIEARELRKSYARTAPEIREFGAGISTLSVCCDEIPVAGARRAD